MAYRATHEAMPLFGVYALLFAEQGLDAAQITSLLAVWSVTAFVLEVPSGAWADLLDRRRLLIASAVVYTSAFVTWLLAPSYWGFLAGFVLWSLSDAMKSGTFEAFLYDELAAAGRTHRYGLVRARAETAGVVVMGLAIAAAAPLHQAGGFALVGWVSVAMTLVHLLVAVSLPRAAPVEPPPEEEVVPPPEPVSAAAWLHTLRAGVHEAASAPAVRRVLLAYAAVVALVGLDEYFNLVLAEGGTSVPVIAWVMAGIVLAEAVGTWFADRVALLDRGAHAALVLGAGLLLAWGAWASGTGVWSFGALGVGYAAASSVYVAGDIRLQSAMSGDARATVTSVAGVVAEGGFLVALGLVGLGSLWWDLPEVVAAVALTLALPATLSAWRAPPARPSATAS
ncbi:MFS transporter [Ornithinimicrobium pekingense]|uniref:MFS transporter n=2 Tax=Ornithinimicrobium pekingense TaxID=384677 RepID=A0ABQ2F7P3_9MICO|nr:MFS transporter [Ornithinimicrobium pekingense]